MVQLKEITTKKLSAKLSQAPELEPLSALSTDVSSDASSIHFSEKERRQERYIRARDQIIFCLNVINLIICSALLTKDPKYYVYWNAFIIPVLMIHRLYDFYLKGWQFYMIDFCYAVNLLVVISTVFFPKNEIMSMISFGLSLGPLTFSIYYFRNSFAFTSIEKVTSLFIHGQAPITMFLVRWHDVSGNFAASANGVSEFGIAFLAKWLGGISSFYGIWAIVYCSMIFLVFGKHISRKKLQTLYNYSMSDPRTSTKLLSRGAKWSKMLFMYNHFRMALGLSTIAMVFYFNYWIGLFWLIALIALSVYNGATYTIEYHSAKYEKQFIHTKRY